MLIEKEVTINGHPKNIVFYTKKGYVIKVGQPVKIKIEDLSEGTTIPVSCKCDECGIIKSKPFREYYEATKLTSKYYCYKCKSIKIKKSCLEKYGVDNVMKIESSKIALSKTINEKYGVEHYSQSDDFKNKYKSIMIEKYGVENGFQSEEVKDKIKNSNLEKYGVEYPQQNKEILKKTKNTNIEKYGAETPLQSKEIYDEMMKSNLDKHGVSNTFQLDSSKNKAKETNKLKYNCEYPFQSKIIKDKINDTILKKYNTTHRLKNKEYLEKLVIYNIEKYGVNFPMLSEKIKNEKKEKHNKKTLGKYSSLDIKDIKILNYENNIFKCYHESGNHSFEIFRGILHDRIRDNTSTICTSCNPMYSNKSSHQIALNQFLFENNITFILGDRKILNGKELDVLIPSHNLAIEINGIYWHSEVFKESSYHLEKTQNCLKQGIQLLHIFEDDWIFKTDIIKSLILNKLKLIPNKIQGRQCVVRNVQATTAIEFLNNNHVQGGCKSTYKLGLYHNEELVSLMTFGYRYTNSKKEFELIRFCNKINTNVIGAASKIFKYFIKHYSASIEEGYIMSYSDLSLFDGNMYKILGFEYKHLSKPNYFWVVKNKREHRFKYNKQKLIKEGFDPLKTEVEIMHERGYNRIFGCGQVRWEYTIDK